jgi:hypothetical protein
VGRVRRALFALGLKPTDGTRRRVLLILVLFAASAILPAAPAYAATLSSASVALSDSEPSTTGVTYTFTGSSFTNSNIQCIQAVFSTSPSNQVNPSGWTGSGGSINTSASSLFSSWSGWSLATSDGSGATVGSGNVWQYTHSGGVTPNTLTGATFVMSGITNSSVSGTAYDLELTTYNNTNCSSSPVDNVTVAFINTGGSVLSMTVNPTLTTSLTGVSSGTPCDGSTTSVTTTPTSIPYGVVTSAANSMACQEVTASTNAANGYTLYIRQTGPLTNSVGHNFSGVSGTNAVPTVFPAAGTEAYGYTTSSSTLSTCGGSCNANRFTDGSSYNDYAAYTTANAEIGYATSADSTNYFIGQQVGVDISTPEGSYQTTVVYTCTPVY